MKQNTKPALFFEEFGQGEPLVLLHGLAVNGDMFSPVTDRLSQGHRLIVPDLRGHGRSEALPGPYSPKHMSEDVRELLDSLFIKSAGVLGYSEGGAVAQQFARDHPDRISSLILVCPFVYGAGTLSQLAEGMFSPLLARTVGMKRIGRMALRLSGVPKLSQGLLQQFDDMLPTDPDKIAQAIKEMNRFDSRPWLNQIKAKTLIIAGSDDKAIPLSQAGTLARDITNSQLKILKGAGHFLVLTHTEELVSLIETFLSEGDAFAAAG